MDECLVPFGHIELTSYLGINILAHVYGSWTSSAGPRYLMIVLHQSQSPIPHPQTLRTLALHHLQPPFQYPSHLNAKMPDFTGLELTGKTAIVTGASRYAGHVSYS